MVKQIIFSILFSFGVNFSYCQKVNVYNNFSFSEGDFSKYIITYLSNKVTDEMDTLCIKSCTFISFIVNTEGNVDSIFCNRGTPKPLNDLFFQAIKSTNGYWKFIDSKQKQEQRFLLPICYQFAGTNCQIKNTTFDNIMNMLDFSDNDKSKEKIWFPTNLLKVNCITLGPMYFGSTFH